MALALLGACSDARANRAADQLLPSATDLGAGYEEVPVASAVEGPCSFAIDEPKRGAARSFVSNAAQERIDLQILRYQDDRTATAAFADAKSVSSCRPSHLGDSAGQPKGVEVEGAQTSFDIGFTDQVDSMGVTVAVLGSTLVVLQSTLHHGASTAEPLGAHAATARTIARHR